MECASRIGDAQTTRAFDGLFAKMEEMHKIWADKPHYYVAIMAVEPTSQGTGKCSKLPCARSTEWPTPRVCGLLPGVLGCKRNRAIYKRFGYAEKGVYTVTVEKEEEGSEPYKALLVRWYGRRVYARPWRRERGWRASDVEKKGPFGLWCCPASWRARESAERRVSMYLGESVG